MPRCARLTGSVAGAAERQGAVLAFLRERADRSFSLDDIFLALRRIATKAQIDSATSRLRDKGLVELAQRGNRGGRESLWRAAQERKVG